MATKKSPTVYKWANVEEANAHFQKLNSWFRAEESDRRIITGTAHGNYVSTEQINDFVGGSVPRSLLVETSEDFYAVVGKRRLLTLQRYLDGEVQS